MAKRLTLASDSFQLLHLSQFGLFLYLLLVTREDLPTAR